MSRLCHRSLTATALHARSMQHSAGAWPLRSIAIRQFSTEKKPADPFKILFCGSDAFSVASLTALLGAEDVWQSISVLVPPERKVSRGLKKTYIPPLKEFAIDNALPIYDMPTTGLSGGYAFPQPFTQTHPTHLLLTASFGHIVPTPLLTPFSHALNVHPSNLPKYRGAAPIQWTIANGDETTGVSIQTIGAREVGVDSGSILGSVSGVPVPPGATYPTLLPDLAHLGGKLLVAVLRQMLRGECTPHAQDTTQITHAPKLTTQKARVSWDRDSARTVERRHRGFGHQVPLWTEFTANGDTTKSLQLIAMRPVSQQEVEATLMRLPTPAPQLPGTVVLDRRGGRVLVATVGDASGAGEWLEVSRVKAAGRKEIPAAEWFNGLSQADRKRGWTAFA